MQLLRQTKLLSRLTVLPVRKRLKNSPNRRRMRKSPLPMKNRRKTLRRLRQTTKPKIRIKNKPVKNRKKKAGESDAQPEKPSGEETEKSS